MLRTLITSIHFQDLNAKKATYTKHQEDLGDDHLNVPFIPSFISADIYITAWPIEVRLSYQRQSPTFTLEWGEESQNPHS